MNKRVEISIVTRPLIPFQNQWAYFLLKEKVKNILGINRGPEAVLHSLIRGLKSHSINYNLNPNVKSLASTVHVLSNPIALKQIINLKDRGIVKKIVAGPNVSILPSYDEGVMCNSSIDKILLPSQWTKDAFLIDYPGLSNKISIWPSGVKVPESKTIRDGSFLIFKKSFPEDLYKKVIGVLEDKNINFNVICYGNYTQKEYFRLLGLCSGMIYLQKSESQGLALQEAWARDVPTLVWNSKSYTYENTKITVNGKIGSPYLTDQSGMFFESIEDFDERLSEFISKINTFTPRKYCTDNLSDEASVKIYLESI